MVIDQREVHRLLSDPRFGPALVRFCTELPGRYARDWKSSRSLVEARRYGVAVLIAHYGAGVSARPLGKMELVDLCERGGLAHRRAVEGALATLQAAAFIEQVPDPADRRARLLLPTEGLLQHLRGSLACRLDCLSTLYHLPATAEEMADQPQALGGALEAEVFLFQNHGAKLHDTSPAVRFFTERLTGFFLLLELVGRAEQAPPGRPFAFSTKSAAERLCVSRTHVAKLLIEAQDAGILHRLPGPGTRIRLIAHQDLRAAVATEFAWTAAHQRLTPLHC